MTAEQINALLHARIRGAADRKTPRSREEWESGAPYRLESLKKALGLFPDPPRTDLRATKLVEQAREGYRFEVWSYEPRPGFVAMAHLYLPASEAICPVVIQAHEAFPNQTSESWVQARGISLALAGIAALIVAPPGKFFDTPSERGALGDPNDPQLHAGQPWMGAYVWDVLRAIDVIESDHRLNHAAIGAFGDGIAGQAALFAFALDSRITCLATAFNAESYEFVDPATAFWSVVPGLAELGDVADLLAQRAPAPTFLIGSNETSTGIAPALQSTRDKLGRYHRLYKVEDAARAESVFGPPDVNRRVREAALAFFSQRLLGAEAAPYRAEARPLTDGSLNPYPNWTEAPDSLAISLPLGSETLASIASRSANEPHPAPLDAESRLIPWGRYGHIDLPKIGPTLRLSDSTEGDSAPDVVRLPIEGVDVPAALHGGLSLAETYAQLLHLSIPGAPEGWESAAHNADVLTSVIASVKSLIKSSSSNEVVSHVEAQGPLASMTAQWLKLYRPDLNVTTSHAFESWNDLAAQNCAELTTPQSRYLKFP